MGNEQNIHDMNDAMRAVIEPLLSGQRGQWGGITEDNWRLSTEYFGFCELAHLGVICHPNTGNVTPSTNVFDVGEIVRMLENPRGAGN